MRKIIKKRLHSGQMGIVKTKLIARDSVYWPGIDTEIDELVLNCELCQIYRNLQPSESEIKHDIPVTPWAKVSHGPYTSTPPATLMFQCPIRSLIPSVKGNREMEVKKLKRRSEVNEENKKYKENRKLKELSKLQMKDKVRLHDGKAWNIKGIIIDTSQHPRSYIIKTDKGTIVRRNRKHIQISIRDNIQLDDEIIIPMNQVVPLIEPNVEDIDVLMDNLSNLSIDDDSYISEPEILIPEPVTTRYGRRIQTPLHLQEYELES